MRVAVIAPHDVDLVQSCGGYVSRLDREGVEVFGVNVKRHDHDTVVAAAKACGYTSLELAQASWEGPMPSREHLQGWLSGQMAVIKPSIVISPWIHDRSSDHRMVAEVMDRILIPWSISPVRRVLAYSTSWWLDFPANVRVQLGQDYMERKLKACKFFDDAAYANHPKALRSIRSRMEAAGSIAGVDFAEEFVLLWEKV